MKRSKDRCWFFVVGVLIFCFASFVSAANIRNFSDRIPSQQEFIDALEPKTTNDRQIRSRGIRPLQPQIEETESGASIELNFRFDSDQLTPKAETVLDNLGGALQDKGLREFAFRIEGHTDSIGNHDYNMDLSTRRANTVKNYLLTNFSISSESLETTGKGESELLDPSNPTSPNNRRVQVINIGKK